MENSTNKNFMWFLNEQEKLTEARLAGLYNIIDSGTDLQLPGHILEALDRLRQNAEDDLSHILHIQSTLPSSVPRPDTVSPRISDDVTPELEHLEPIVEGRHGAGQFSLADGSDDMFTLSLNDELTETRTSTPMMPSDEDQEDQEADSEPDEGIHMPSTFRQNKSAEVAASLPVGIPWSAQLPASRGVERQRAPVVRGHTSDTGETRDSVHIAASIPALAKSVHTRSDFGDNVFGDLPRPRKNTYSKD